MEFPDEKIEIELTSNSL